MDLNFLKEVATWHQESALPILDAEIGTGIIKFACPAQPTGFSMLIMFVSQYLTNALLMMRQVLVLLATLDMTCQLVLASSLPQTMLSPQTLDVLIGTGIMIDA